MNDEPTNEKKIKCAIYARSATNDTNSIERQLQTCREYIAKQVNWTLSETFVDCAESGLSADRPRLRALLQAMQMNHSLFDHLVIEESSRLGRDLNLVAKMLKIFESACVSLHVAASGSEISADTLYTALTLDAQYRFELAACVHKGQLARFHAGHVAGVGTPYRGTSPADLLGGRSESRSTPKGTDIVPRRSRESFNSQEMAMNQRRRGKGKRSKDLGHVTRHPVTLMFRASLKVSPTSVREMIRDGLARLIAARIEAMLKRKRSATVSAVRQPSKEKRNGK